MKYKAIDFDGNPVKDDEGNVLRMEYEEALEAAKPMGTVALITEQDFFDDEEPGTEPEEIISLSPYQQEYFTVLAMATHHVNVKYPRLKGKKRDARVALAALTELETRRRNNKSMSLTVLTKVKTEGLHKVLGYQTIRAYMEAAGMDCYGGYYYQIAQVAENVVPAMISAGEDPADYIGPGGKTSKLLAAAPSLNEAATARDYARIRELLKTIDEQPTVRAVREEFAPRRELIGRGMDFKLEHGTYALVMVFNRKEDVAWAKQRMERRIEWDLIGDGSLNKSGARLDIQV